MEKGGEFTPQSSADTNMHFYCFKHDPASCTNFSSEGKQIFYGSRERGVIRVRAEQRTSPEMTLQDLIDVSAGD